MKYCNELKKQYQDCLKQPFSGAIYENCNILKGIYRNCLRNLLNNYNLDINYNIIFNILSQNIINMNFPLTIQKTRNDLLGSRLFTQVDFNKINEFYFELDITDKYGKPYILNPKINPQLYWLSSNTSNRVGADIFFPVNNNRIQLQNNINDQTSKGWVCKNRINGNWYKAVLNKIIPLYIQNFKNYFYEEYLNQYKINIDDINCEILVNENDLNSFKFSISNLNSTYLDNIIKILYENDFILNKPDFIITLKNGDTFKLLTSILEFGKHVDLTFGFIYYNDKLLEDKEKDYKIKFSTDKSPEAFYLNEESEIEIFVSNIVNIDLIYSFPNHKYISYIQSSYINPIYEKNIPNELEILYKIIFMTDTYTNFQLGIQLQHNNFLANKTLKQDFIKNIDKLEEIFHLKLNELSKIREVQTVDISGNRYKRGTRHYKFLQIFYNDYNDIINNIFSERELMKKYQISNCEIPEINGIYIQNTDRQGLVQESPNNHNKIIWKLSYKLFSDDIIDIIFNINSEIHPDMNKDQIMKTKKIKVKANQISKYLENNPNTDLAEYFKNLNEIQKKKYSDEEQLKIIIEINELTPEKKNQQNIGGQWIIYSSISKAIAYQVENSSPTGSIDSITSDKEWFLNDNDVENYLNRYNNYKNKSSLTVTEVDLTINKKITLIIEDLKKKYEFNDIARILKLPTYENMEVTLFENIDFKDILDFVKNNIITEHISSELELKILKILLFYCYLDNVITKLDNYFNERYIQERNEDFKKQKRTIIYSDLDILNHYKAQEPENLPSGINPFRYQIDMKSKNIKLIDSNWWMNSNSNFINFFKTFFLNNGLDEETNTFFQLSEQLPLINLNKSISISYEFKSSSPDYGVISPIYKNLDLDINKIYYNNAKFCNDPISSDLIWTPKD